MAVADSTPTLPFERTILQLAPTYRVLQDSSPVARVRTPAGDPAWLALSYDAVRTLLGNPHLGRSHPDPERAPVFSQSAFLGRPMGNAATERADHSRTRQVMNRSFGQRRMETLRPRVQTLVDGLLDELAAATPPADLHAALAFPLPVLVICELLGVPFDDRGDFRRWSDGAMDMVDRERATSSLEKLAGYMRGLIEAKREQPGEDVISDLVHAADVEGRLTEDEMVGIGAGLLFAGHETTVTRIDYGTLLLLTHPGQRAALQRDPSLAASAAEEILRYATSSIGAVPRYAMEDIEVAGVRIRAGEMVLLGLQAANRDARTFEEPDRFDITRTPNPHVTFGYGYRFCLGAPLARVELQCALGSLLQRFPALELAVPLSEIRERSNLLTGGVEALPVTW